MSWIQYNGRKVILNVELPRRKVTPWLPDSCISTCITTSKISATAQLRLFEGVATLSDEDLDSVSAEALASMMNFGFEDLSDMISSFDIELFADIEDQENSVLKELLGLLVLSPMREGIPSALRPIWEFCEGVPFEERISDLRDIREQFVRSPGQGFDVRGSISATGRLQYTACPLYPADDQVEPGTVAYFDSGRLVVICNILVELRRSGIVEMRARRRISLPKFSAKSWETIGGALRKT
ncbi:hypothetical protein DFH09DRAFT_395099 [Mycena vulgaris]|nr:hypothetical protein DFH09DRAFT_395099 [Mycena vulgaris]